MSTEETPAPAPVDEAPITMDSISSYISPGSEPPPPPQPITIDDILNDIQLLTQKEAADKLILESIGNMSYDELRQKLVLWATARFPNVYEIHRISVIPPTKCSDGVSRDLADYITFCSGKTINEHVAILQSRVDQMVISFANMGSYIAIVVSKV